MPQLNSLCGDIQTIKLPLLALSVGALIDYTTHQEVGRVAKWAAIYKFVQLVQLVVQKNILQRLLIWRRKTINRLQHTGKEEGSTSAKPNEQQFTNLSN